MTQKINEIYYDRIFVMDNDGEGVTGLVNADFSKDLDKDGVATTETVTVTEQGDGYYYVTFTPEDAGTYSYLITQATYQPEGWYNDILVRSYSNDDIKTDTTTIISNVNTIDTNVDTINTKLDTISTNILRLLGLSHENVYIDEQVYDANYSLTSARIRSYSVAGSVGTDNDVLATYTVTATYDGENLLTSYSVVKQ
jgi:phospholipase/lecithinase/hemolysin